MNLMIPVTKKLPINLRNGNLYNQERQSEINANSAERVETEANLEDVTREGAFELGH